MLFKSFHKILSKRTKCRHFKKALIPSFLSLLIYLLCKSFSPSVRPLKRYTTEKKKKKEIKEKRKKGNARKSLKEVIQKF